MLWVAEHDSFASGIHYGFDLLEEGRALSFVAVARATTILLGARSHTTSDAEAASRIRDRPDTGDPEDWLGLSPALDWFDATQLSEEMQAVAMGVVERVILAIARVREAETLDAYVLGLCTIHKLVEALRLVIQPTTRFPLHSGRFVLSSTRLSRTM